MSMLVKRSRRLLLLFVCIVIAVGGGAIWATLAPPSYLAQGEVQITVTDPRNTNSDVNLAEHIARQLAITYAVTATSSSVTASASTACNATTEDGPTVQAYAVQRTSIIRVLARGARGDCTVAYAQAISDALVSTIESTENSDIRFVNAVVIDDPAQNLKSVRPPAQFYILASALFGAIGGLAIGYYRDSREYGSTTAGAST